MSKWRNLSWADISPGDMIYWWNSVLLKSSSAQVTLLSWSISYSIYCTNHICRWRMHITQLDFSKIIPSETEIPKETSRPFWLSLRKIIAKWGGSAWSSCHREPVIESRLQRVWWVRSDWDLYFKSGVQMGLTTVWTRHAMSGIGDFHFIALCGQLGETSGRGWSR